MSEPGTSAGLSVIIPWCDRPELATTLAEHREVFGPGLEVVVVNCGGDVAELDRILSEAVQNGTFELRRVDLPGASFNKALALNAGVAASRAPRLFFLDTDVVVGQDFLNGARQQLTGGDGGDDTVEDIVQDTFVTVERVVESSPVASHDMPSLQQMAHLIELVTEDGTVRVETNRQHFADGARGGPGLILLRRDDFEAVGGVNSDLEGWGFEDVDLVLRLQLARGLARQAYGEVRHLSHGDDVRHVTAGSAVENEALNRAQALYNYGQRYYLGTYEDDRQQWLERWQIRDDWQHESPAPEAKEDTPREATETQPSPRIANLQSAEHQPIRLSIVDQVPLRRGGRPREAFAECVRLAQTAEQLGYERFWIAEHHNASSFACTSPEALIPLVAAATSRIRVGSGATLLRNTTALKAAELFRTLSAYFPDRIDLGMGGATGGDPQASRALAHPHPVLGSEDYAEQIRDLLGFLVGNLPPDHDFAAVRSQLGDRSAPGEPGVDLPQTWLLGGSTSSARFAGRNGLRYAFADFLTDDRTLARAAAHTYRDAFEPSPWAKRPTMTIAVEAVCAPSREEAEYLARSRHIDWLAEVYGLEGLLSPEEAAEFDIDDRVRDTFERLSARCMVGTAAELRQRILDLREQTGVADFAIITNCHAFEHRERSYRLLADAFEL